MKFPLFKKDGDRGETFRCKECKMTFHSKESLERHKNKAKHFTGSIYFGKNDS